MSQGAIKSRRLALRQLRETEAAFLLHRGKSRTVRHPQLFDRSQGILVDAETKGVHGGN
jgi:hypothetical protein